MPPPDLTPTSPPPPGLIAFQPRAPFIVPPLLQPPSDRSSRMTDAIAASRLVRMGGEVHLGNIADLRRKFSPDIPVYVIGDVHGRHDNVLKVLMATGLLEKLEQCKGVLVFLGDLTHPDTKDPVKSLLMDDSIRTLDLYLELKRRFPSHVFSAIGNHDQHKNDLPPPTDLDAAVRKPSQGSTFLTEMASHFPDEADRVRYLLDVEKVTALQPLVVVGHGFVAVHGGPTVGLSRFDIMNATIEDRPVLQQSKPVQQCAWTRHRGLKPIRLDAGWTYTLKDVDPFLAMMEQPDGVLLCGHTKPDSTDIWRMGLSPKHSILMASLDAVGYALIHNHVVSYHTVSGREIDRNDLE